MEAHVAQVAAEAEAYSLHYGTNPEPAVRHSGEAAAEASCDVAGLLEPRLALPPAVRTYGGAAMPDSRASLPPLLAQRRPRIISEAVEKAAVAVSRRQGEWGVDGIWSYDFSELGYACAATSGAHVALGNRETSHSSGSNERANVLKGSLDRMLCAGGTALRVLDLGAGSGGWLLQAGKELEEQIEDGTGRQSPFVIHLHGVTGDALASELRAAPSVARADRVVKVANFQQVGIETFPLRLGDIREHRAHFAPVETALAGGPGYDLIVSSWTFCHLVDPLATLEMWSNALAVGGELYLNDIDFFVVFESESAALTSHSRKEEVQEDSTGGAPRPRVHESCKSRPADDSAASWQVDPEMRMKRAFDELNTRGEGADGAFTLEFVYDDVDYRTAVKVTRLSAAPIRFGPMFGYHGADGGQSPPLDSGGRALYCVSGMGPTATPTPSPDHKVSN